MIPVLYIIVPCYNEEQVLPITAPLFLAKITDLALAKCKITDVSLKIQQIFFVGEKKKHLLQSFL